MQPSPLNLKKGDYVVHSSGVKGRITQRKVPHLFVEDNAGTTHKFFDAPVQFTRLTPTEYKNG